MLAARPPEEMAEKLHRARRVRERNQPRVVQRRDQEAAGDAHRFADVVVLAPGAFLGAAREDGDERGRDVEKLLLGARLQRRQIGQPFGRGPVLVEFGLFLFGRDADAVLQGGVGHQREGPGLLVGPRGRLRGGLDAMKQHLARHGLAAKLAHRAPPAHRGEERRRARGHLGGRQARQVEGPRAVLAS